ncbi:MAG: hypothetical protein LBE85_07250 [Candidatus Accumulibacter sp.]|nr:hypothetical protein [Accumulibacter sp.]
MFVDEISQVSGISVADVEKAIYDATGLPIYSPIGPKWWSTPSSKQAWQENHARLDGVRGIENGMGEPLKTSRISLLLLFPARAKSGGINLI